ncbi:MAG: glycosyltransferase [Arcobacter sp.]|nr:MAG: glycosyltransferase [Arcobacter sp.]PHR71958.1 MAG: glycosyltransferase [Arcobacter sp.]
MIKKLETLSIVIPCYNEEEVIYESYTIIKKLLNKWCNTIISDYEIILVNNGSTDNTFKEMYKIYQEDKNIVILDLRNNFGYQGSISAGLFNASKDMIVTVDSDLQDDPSKIEDMILKYYDGYDLVLGIRQNRGSDSFLKKHTAQAYYKLLNLLGVNSVYNHGDFRLMSKSLLEDFKNYSEKNRYLRGIITNLESKYACVYYDRLKRTKGESKFNISSLLSLAIDGITSFSAIPIRFISIFGIFMFFFSILGVIYVIYEKFVNNVEVPGWAFTSILIMLFGGLNSLFIGIVGEYVGKTYIETKQRPIFTIRKKYKRE